MNQKIGNVYALDITKNIARINILCIQFMLSDQYTIKKKSPSTFYQVFSERYLITNGFSTAHQISSLPILCEENSMLVPESFT